MAGTPNQITSRFKSPPTTNQQASEFIFKRSPSPGPTLPATTFKGFPSPKLPEITITRPTSPSYGLFKRATTPNMEKRVGNTITKHTTPQAPE